MSEKVKSKKDGAAPYVSEDELDITLSALKGLNSLRNQCIILCSHFMGLRAQELAWLVIGDVYDINRNIIKETIRLTSSITKGEKFREVYLVNPKLKELLLEYILTHRPKDNNAPLFLSQKGGSFSPDTMQKLIAREYKKAGINATSHSGRRSFATNLIRRNVDIHAVQQLMGHTSILTTQKYFQTDPNLLKEATSKLN
ncbi:tyrosine-type recombinase/integrase [Acinetobacter soli]|uniref:Integrase n=1 Tax=Acinetobacter soli TaxID=487316 RepID=A0A1P8ENI8_9GAMM|nr:site-specific integrase [Acinetobacter soli]APV37757.1 integrase [Acinetobacter soli]